MDTNCDSMDTDRDSMDTNGDSMDTNGDSVDTNGDSMDTDGDSFPGTSTTLSPPPLHITSSPYIRPQSSRYPWISPTADDHYKSLFPDGRKEVWKHIDPDELSREPTEEEVMSIYEKAEAEIKASEMWRALKKQLEERVLREMGSVETAICLGVGGCTGRVWPPPDSDEDPGDLLTLEELIDLIEADEVDYSRLGSMAQLALFKSIVTLIGEFSHIHNVVPSRKPITAYPRCSLPEHHQSRSVPAFAQEPYYNAHDRRLHSTLGIQCVDHPTAFCLITTNSFVLAMSAEEYVLQKIVFYNPCLLLANSLTTYRDSVDGRWRAGGVGAVHYFDNGDVLAFHTPKPGGRGQGHEPGQGLTEEVIEARAQASDTWGREDEGKKTEAEAEAERAQRLLDIEEQKRESKHEFVEAAVRMGEMSVTFKMGKDCWRIPDCLDCGYAVHTQWLYWRSDRVGRYEVADEIGKGST